MSKNTRFDIQSASRALSYCLIRCLTRLAAPLAGAGGYVYRSGDLAPAEGSTRGDAGALGKDACPNFTMRACRGSATIGEPLNAKRMTTVSPVSQGATCHRGFLSASFLLFIPLALSLSRIEGSIRLFGT